MGVIGAAMRWLRDLLGDEGQEISGRTFWDFSSE